MYVINQSAFRDNLTPRKNKKQWKIFSNDSARRRTRDLNSRAKSRRNCCDRHEINELPIYWRRKLRNNFKASHQLSYESLENDVKAQRRMFRWPDSLAIRSSTNLLENNQRIRKVEGNRFESFDCGWSLASVRGLKSKKNRVKLCFQFFDKKEISWSIVIATVGNPRCTLELLFLVSVKEANVGAQRLRETFSLLLSLLASVVPKYGRCSISRPIFICSHLKPEITALDVCPRCFASNRTFGFKYWLTINCV